MITDQLLAKYPIISDQVDTKELGVLLRELEKLLQGGAAGNIVEFGCYVGTTSLFIRRLLDVYKFTGEFHVYDSFAGLPEKTQLDASAAGEQFKAGELLAPRKTFIQNFKKAGLKLPTIHKGWFADFTPDDVPESIIFAFLTAIFMSQLPIHSACAAANFRKRRLSSLMTMPMKLCQAPRERSISGWLIIGNIRREQSLVWQLFTSFSIVFLKVA